MPFVREFYPLEWESEIRPRILRRAGHKCEWCGIPNYSIVWRHPHEDCWQLFTLDPAKAFEWYGDRYEQEGSKIVLTIAHIHDANPMACEDENLAALCNACHLRHDAKMHAMNAIRTKQKALEDAGQLRLF